MVDKLLKIRTVLCDMHIIVGGSEITKMLASKLDDYVILESRGDVVEKLRGEGFKVVKANPADPEVLSKFDITSNVLILASDDETNLKVINTAKTLGAENVIVVTKRDKLYRGEDVKICRSYGDLLHVLNFEKPRKYFEIKVRENWKGLKLKELDLGEECAVVSIFRNGRLIRPHPEFTLGRGDVVGIICGEEVRSARNPFDEILVVLRGHRDEDVVKEAKMLAEKFRSNTIFIRKTKNEFKCVENVRIFKPKDVKKVLIKDSEKFDLIVTSAKRKRDNLIEKFVNLFPTLIAKGKSNYSKILAIANSSNPYKIISLAKAFGRVFDYVKVLFLEKDQLKYFSRFIETPVDVDVSEGNPFVDTVREFKKGYDLVIFSLKNDVGNIDKDILWKIVLDTDSSVLIV
jgi:trk system potassium uptake protein TrkA